MLQSAVNSDGVANSKTTDSKRASNAKTKRQYTRQAAFDKYSFRFSTDESGLTDKAGTEMDRGEGKHRILTNDVSTDEPEVGAAVTVVYSEKMGGKGNKDNGCGHTGNLSPL